MLQIHLLRRSGVRGAYVVRRVFARTGGEKVRAEASGRKVESK